MKPACLKKNDKIAILAPSGSLSSFFPDRLIRAKKSLESIGFRPVAYPTVDLNIRGKAGTVRQRLDDLHSAFGDKEIKGIICTSGGYSSNDLIEGLDFGLIKKNPKVFCGYSDITVLHYAIHNITGLITFYGPSAINQFGEFPCPDRFSIDNFLKAISSKEIIGLMHHSAKWTGEFIDWSKNTRRKYMKNEGPIWLMPGKSSGKLIGGCLDSFLKLRGTRFDADYEDKILFIETPEGEDMAKGHPLILIDSMFRDLHIGGILDQISGLIIGRPYGYDEAEQLQFRAMIKEHVKCLDIPVLVNVDIGHTDPMFTIPIGLNATLDSYKYSFSINESAVR